LLNRLEHADQYDVISPSSDIASVVIRRKLAIPLRSNKLQWRNQLNPSIPEISIRSTGWLRHLQADVDLYGLPFMWGPNVMLYDSRTVQTPPESWNELWDRKHRSQVALWDDLSSLCMTAQVLKYDKGDPAALFNLSDAQLQAVKNKLIELKTNLPYLWTSASQLNNLFRERRVALALGWPLTSHQLKSTGYDVEQTIPVEATTGWIDYLMITSSSSHRDLAYEFVNYLTEAETQKWVADVTGYIPVNTHATDYMTADERQHALQFDVWRQRIVFWSDVPRRDKYLQIWHEIKSAFQISSATESRSQR